MDNKHRTKQELAKELNMSLRTLHRRIKQLGIPHSGRLLSPGECAHIAQQLDEHQFFQNFGGATEGER
jgi:hypothetical protein